MKTLLRSMTVLSAAFLFAGDGFGKPDPGGDLFAALDFEHPGLEEVRQAVEQQGWQAARKALARHLRERAFPRWSSDDRALAPPVERFPEWPQKEIAIGNITVTRQTRRS